jgi:hypothetical protein
VEQGEKLSRVPLHSVRTPNSYTKPREGSICSNFDIYMGEATEGEIFVLILGGLHERHGVQFGYRSLSKQYLSIQSVPQKERHTSPFQI